MTDIPINEDGKRETPAETSERLREKRKPREIPRHYFEGTDPELGEAPPTQEELFRKAAVECFQLRRACRIDESIAMAIHRP